MHSAYKERISLPEASEQNNIQFNSYLNSQFLTDVEKSDDFSFRYLAGRQNYHLQARTVDTNKPPSTIRSHRAVDPLAANSRASFKFATCSCLFTESGNQNPLRITSDQSFLVTLA